MLKVLRLFGEIQQENIKSIRKKVLEGLYAGMEMTNFLDVATSHV